MEFSCEKDFLSGFMKSLSFRFVLDSAAPTAAGDPGGLELNARLCPEGDARIKGKFDGDLLRADYSDSKGRLIPAQWNAQGNLVSPK